MKKKILLLVRRSYLEIEYILSVLKILKKDYEIYAYIENDLALKSLKKEEIFFKEFLKIIKNLKVNQKTNYLLQKVFLKILLFFNLSNLKLFNKIYDYVYDISNIQNIFNINNSFDFIMTDYNSKSQIIRSSFLKKKRNFKIIFFTTSPLTTPGLSNSYNIKKKISPYPNVKYSDFLFVNSSYERYLWSRYISKKKIFSIGIPLFYKSRNRKKIKTKTKKVIISYNCPIDKKIQIKSKKIIKKILVILSKVKNIEILIKVHPIKREKYIYDLVNEINVNNIKFSEKNLIELFYNANLHISLSRTAAITYANHFNVPSIAWTEERRDLGELQEKMGLVNVYPDINILINTAKRILYKDSKIKFRQYKNYKKFYSSNPKNKILHIFNIMKRIN